MKVCLYNLTTTTRYGGVESFVWEVARRLAEKGCDTTIVGGNGAIRRPYENVRVVTFPFLSREKQRALPGMSKQYTATKLAERLTLGVRSFRYLQQQKFDIIHIQKPYDLPVSSLLHARGACKIVFGCHGTDFFPGDRRFIGAVDIAVSCSAFNAAQVREHFGIAPRVVFNGFNPEIFFPRPPDPDFRRALAGDAATVLYAGRLVRWKGVQYLIDAMAKISKGRAVTLLIAGQGEYQAVLEQRARDSGIVDAVKFLGYITPEELPRYYAVADVVALASYANETFSISSLEAMACARPVVATRFGGIPEVVTDGESGFLVEPENPNDLADKIERLLDDAALRTRFGMCGRTRAMATFTWDEVTARVLAAYNSIL